MIPANKKTISKNLFDSITSDIVGDLFDFEIFKKSNRIIFSDSCAYSYKETL